MVFISLVFFNDSVCSCTYTISTASFPFAYHILFCLLHTSCQIYSISSHYSLFVTVTRQPSPVTTSPSLILHHTQEMHFFQALSSKCFSGFDYFPSFLSTKKVVIFFRSWNSMLKQKIFVLVTRWYKCLTGKSLFYMDYISKYRFSFLVFTIVSSTRDFQFNSVIVISQHHISSHLSRRGKRKQHA